MHVRHVHVQLQVEIQYSIVFSLMSVYCDMYLLVLVLVNSNTLENSSFYSKCLSTDSQSLNNFICLKVVLEEFNYKALIGQSCCVIFLKINVLYMYMYTMCQVVTTHVYTCKVKIYIKLLKN